MFSLKHYVIILCISQRNGKHVVKQRFTHTLAQKHTMHGLISVIRNLLPPNKTYSQNEFTFAIAKILPSPINNKYFDDRLTHDIIRFLFENYRVKRGLMYEHLLAQKAIISNKLYLPELSYNETTSLTVAQELVFADKIARYNTVNHLVVMPSNTAAFEKVLPNAEIYQYLKKMAGQSNFDVLISHNSNSNIWYGDNVSDQLMRSRFNYSGGDFKTGRSYASKCRINHLYLKENVEIKPTIIKEFDRKVYVRILLEKKSL
jgi:hypothetical protein